ncbi:MAG: DUF1292 domain-containing protein [Clostridium sp.]|uniref:DUF1292 domain-containing protein n=1 Tax=Clostridium sp. TaxID=1506 RepID=UPI00305636A4
MGNINQCIKVSGEDGKSVELEFIDVVKVGSLEYVIAGPKNSDEACAYKVVSRENGMVEYASVGEGREFNKVLTAYNNQQH